MMAVASEAPVEAESDEAVPRKPWPVLALDWIRKYPLGAAGFAVVLAMILMAALADLIAPHDPVLNKFEDMLLSPDAVYWMGTDQFGRDILSRTIYGSRAALFIGFTAAFIGATSGLVLGVGSAYFGGRVDLLLQRVIDVF